MSQATVRFDLGAESVTVPLDIDLPTSVPLSGDVSGTFGDCFVAGDLNLTGNLFIEGLMTGIDTFHVQGNGFTVFFQNGGRADLHGKVKAAWGPWGTDTTGWVTGDRVAVAPMARGKILALPELSWSGAWASMIRPTDAPDVTLYGTIHKPEVVNLSQSIVFENLGRGCHIHDSGGIQLLSDVKFLNCGTVGVLGNYPHHFHMVGENSRGSLLERVVVEGGKNHAFVPHASHGVTYRGCVAYKTTDIPYWWDGPPVDDDTNPVNDTNDVVWDRCLAMFVLPSGTGDTNRMTSFALGAGVGNACVDSVAVGHGRVAGINDKNSSGFRWLENNVWIFDRCKAHNNRRNGIFVWTQSPNVHPLENFTAFHNLRSPVEHGAYINSFQYRGGVFFTGNKVASGSDETAAVFQHAMSRETTPGAGLLFEDIKTDDRLLILQHSVDPQVFATHRRCTYSNVVYLEGTQDRSLIRYEDCGLTPAQFNMTGARPTSIAEIYEGGVLAHRWAAGAWS